MNEWINQNQPLLTALAALAAIFSVLISAYAATAAARAAEAAGLQAEISEKLLLSDQRPWIGVQLIFDSDLDFDDGSTSPLRYSTSANILVRAKITNQGKTPALRVNSNMKIFVRNHSEDINAVAKEFADESRNHGDDSGRLVMPGEEYFRPWHLSIPVSEIENDSGATSFYANILVCVSYEIPHDKSVHQTVLSLLLGTRNESRFVHSIPIGERRIPRETLDVNHWNGGFAT